MFLIKGYLIKCFESIMLDADNKEQAIKIYNRKFSIGEPKSIDENLEIELMEIEEENNKKENK